MIVTTSYTANMTAFISMDKIQTSIKNADELSRQTKIQYGVVAGSTTHMFFKHSTNPTYRRMYAMMKANRSVFVKNNTEGVEWVANGHRDYAFLCETPLIEYVVNRNSNLTQVGDPLDSKHYGIATPFGEYFVEDYCDCYTLWDTNIVHRFAVSQEHQPTHPRIAGSRHTEDAKAEMVEPDTNGRLPWGVKE